MITLYSDYGCPFAHRVEAVLHHLEQPYRIQLVEPAEEVAALRALSPSGRVPLVTVGVVKLYEAAVIADYFAETLGWRDAYPAEAERRAHHRIAIRRLEAVWQTFADGLAGRRPATSAARIDEDLDHLEETVRATSHAPSLLAFTAVPFWQRWTWSENRSELAARVRGRAALEGWLRAAAELPALRATAPDPARTRDVHQLG